MKWICRPVIVYNDPYFDQPCTPETGGKPGTIHRDCGWVGDEPDDEYLMAALRKANREGLL